jgi:hypothetical protein
MLAFQNNKNYSNLNRTFFFIIFINYFKYKLDVNGLLDLSTFSNMTSKKFITSIGIQFIFKIINKNNFFRIYDQKEFLVILDNLKRILNHLKSF